MSQFEKILTKAILSIGVAFVGFYAGIFLGLILWGEGLHEIVAFAASFSLAIMLLCLIWIPKRKLIFVIWLLFLAVLLIVQGILFGLAWYKDSITISTSPNINTHEYLPFTEDSKIVKRESRSLQLSEPLPRIDGAAALFPVYSAFVNATYPDTTALGDGVFAYRNTPSGYRALAEKRSDIFIGVYPSQEQQDYAKECGTEFLYTPIGNEAFVFFVHKNNPIDSLTTEQIQDIYAGRITNWQDLGGRDEEIVAFQRNEGSGSQSMLKRFMAGKELASPPTERVNDMMAGIIEKVADYQSKSGSIGFSFRFYVEGIIKNPDIKMLAIDGVAPTAENIKNGTYPVVTPIYAVTYQDNPNENVPKLVDWILSPEGQEIIEETGYVGIGER